MQAKRTGVSWDVGSRSDATHDCSPLRIFTRKE
jgi:hypothetical protein